MFGRLNPDLFSPLHLLSTLGPSPGLVRSLSCWPVCMHGPEMGFHLQGPLLAGVWAANKAAERKRDLDLFLGEPESCIPGLSKYGACIAYNRLGCIPLSPARIDP